MAKGRLDKWFPGVVASAEQSVRKEADAAGEAARERKEMDDMIANGFGPGDKLPNQTVQVNGVSGGHGDDLTQL